MNILTLMGSCRIEGINRYFNTTILNKISYLHSTKEHIQFLKFVKGDLLIPQPYNRYCFRDSIMNPTHSYLYNPMLKNEFDKTTHFIIEICSNALYINNGFYLHHLAVDKRFAEYKLTSNDIIDTTTKYFQTPEEIENDIDEIKNLIENKKLIIVTHINPNQGNGKKIFRRNELINIVENVCNKRNIPIINPTIIFSKYKQQHQIVNNDLGHLTPLGVDELGTIIYKKIIGENI